MGAVMGCVVGSYADEVLERAAKCPHPLTFDCKLAVDYAGGLSWESKVCWQCLTIVGPREVPDDAIPPSKP